MKQSDYRRKNEGEKVRFRRMPPPDEVKLGSKPIDDYEEDNCKIVQCPNCGKYVPESEIDIDVCPYCPVEDENEK